MRISSGRGAFIVQRLGALVLLAFVVAAAGRLAFGSPPSLAGWRAWSARPAAASALLLLAVALLSHAWVGMRDVLLDYLKPPVLQRALLAGIALGLALLGAWTATILFRHVLLPA